MTNKIEISRELLAAYLASAKGYDDATLREELRALLAAPTVERKPFGWWRVPKDCPLQGCFLVYVEGQSERDMQNAIDHGGFDVRWLCDSPATQHQGEPVDVISLEDCVEFNHPEYGMGWFATDNCRRIEQPAPVIERQEPLLIGHLYRVAEDQIEIELVGDPHIKDGMEVYTSQPAPVAVVLPEYKSLKDAAPDLVSNCIGWNACPGKVKELNP